MTDHQVSDFCQEKFKQLDGHVQESLPVRDDVSTLKNTVSNLQKGYDTLCADVKEIKEQLLGRLPLWATFMFSGMSALIVGLSTFLLTKH